MRPSGLGHERERWSPPLARGASTGGSGAMAAIRQDWQQSAMSGPEGPVSQ